ncbi:MAG: pyruvate kinase [Propionicimonas sp.]|uniref:pyruvate kinase n=1 Tax=Propionicimonas sp. TaxID=1955623 RepID=UPI001D5CA058|nr:pyruvate kinase [Propionicimonas sp.]MBU4093372.1 pyruvate kinase [Actinomycetota bacterium]MBU4187293.1 pyruvate kinase [Actinomycetota bacterium]MBU4206412.1 pyruvate kinase [Actinomycetota bacterium]MBU4249970.1 pyruvate kinase [Actinomycetota bacterium]MBU4364630.1 pyruvate kinase [Actinomycetota bacterium]
MRRAKIVCTIGPATDSAEKLVELVAAGMNVARLNMSHGDHILHAQRVEWIRDAARAAGRPVGILADLQGPKIRLGEFENGAAELVAGQQFVITIEDVAGTAERASTTLKTLTADVTAGDQILINDGAIELVALAVTDTEVITEVIVGGRVSDHKGINLPGVPVSVPALSTKDERDLRWALRHGVDMVALSFVRSAADIEPVRQVMESEGRHVPVIAKLEKPQALENLDAVIDTFDAFMVARGDLGVELPLEDVPSVQKRIIDAARIWAKPVIVATQMLESMITSHRPTRAEVSDVANAILDGADAVMLSGETAVGDYAIEAVEVMSRIVTRTEAEGLDKIRALAWNPHTTPGVISKAAVEVAERVNAKYLAAFTISGDTPHRLARLRSEVPIMAFTPLPKTAQELTLCWGVQSFVTPEYTNTDSMVASVQDALTTTGFLKRGDRVVIVAGNPGRTIYQTNSLRVYEMA